MPEEGPDPEFEALLADVKEVRGFDFTGYKRASLRRRVEKRMQMVGAPTFGDYAAYLEANPDEFQELFDTILINVTSFFRDPQTWEFVAGEVVPRVVAQADSIRIWTPGCASGEEAYTVAMLFAEAIGTDAFVERAKIYATDLDDDALRQGRQATYAGKSAEALAPGLLEKYFTQNGDGYQVRPELRRTVVFGRHDLVRDPPISRVDLLVCRNTLMYFNAETQRRILNNFHFALGANGYLVLGKSEVLMTRSSAFTPFDLRRRVFVRGAPVDVGIATTLRALGADELNGREPDLGVERAAFETGPTATLVVDRAGMLAQANAHARLLLGVAVRDRGRPLAELDVAQRAIELSARLDQAFTERRPVVLRDVDIPRGDRTSSFDVQIVPLTGANGDAVGASISFSDVSGYKTLETSLETARHEVETAYEELQATVEELETTNEELQSTNEELETTNEELHSTNEELETMNEELQSTNEELETMNDELSRRTDDLHETNEFLESVLSSMTSGVIVVNGDLRVLAWNGAAADLWGVSAAEAAGEHLLNLDIGLPVEDLRTPLRQVLRGDVPTAVVEIEARNRRGKTIVCHVIVTPLGRSDAQPRGAILLTEDVTATADAG